MLDALLPRPRRVRAQPGALALHALPPIVLADGADDGDFRSARRLAEALEARTGLRLPVEVHARREDLGPRIELRRGPPGGDPHGEAHDDPDGGTSRGANRGTGSGPDPGADAGSDEAYRIRIDARGAVVTAAGAPGLQHAVETLRQLAHPRGRLPACRIEDAPAFALRGIMLDVSRGKVPDDACLRELVERCARLKLNVLMLYTEHTFRFRRHPEIGADASPLDAETLRALDAYAAERHVELIPTLQSLGHMSHVLKHERYAPLAESELGWSLSPVEPGTYELLDDLLDEYLPNFRSGFYNANCDEPWDLGRGKSRTREAELGAGGVYLEHVRWLHRAAAERGRRAMIWADVVHRHPERVGELPGDLVMLDWWYEAELDYDRAKIFAERGLDFLVCPGTSSWNCLFPRVANSLENISRWADAGRRHGALGLVCTDWGDFGHYNLLGNSWLGYAWAAQEAWSGPVPQKDFDRAFGHAVFEVDGAAARRAARCYRELGAVHDAGFRVFNGSALQYLFFDDLDRAFFLRQARPGALRRTRRRLERARERLDGAELAFGRDALSRDELRYAADASLLALDKTEAARDWLAWRRDPARLDARGRRRLARRLADLAVEQRRLGQRLRRLWDARSRPSNFEITSRRLDASIRSLRRASRALERGRPPGEDPRWAETTFGDVLAELRENAER